MVKQTAAKKISVLLATWSLIFASLGCSTFGKSLKSFLRGEDAAPAEARAKASTPTGKSFSENPNYFMGDRRQYKQRTSKATLEDESQLSDRSGSLWVMEGQGAYLFSQNIMRMIGDPLSVKVEGEPREQLEAKVKIIADLMIKLEDRKKAAQRRIAEKKAQDDKASAKDGKGGKKAGAPKAEGEGATEEATNETTEKSAPVSAEFPVKMVPTRIVERLVDGNYRVKGSQPFMIGKREYQVIVTGIARAEDFSDGGMSAAKLLDPKFDIVSKRSREAAL